MEVIFLSGMDVTDDPYGRWLAGIAGSNPAGGMHVSRECYVLSGTGLCDALITRPEEFYRAWCV